MNGKELVLAAIRNQETPRAPWVPFVGCHAAKLIGVDAETYFKSADLIVQGMTAAVERYRPDGIPALFDLQLEAEALGCSLQWAQSNPPAVASHPLESGMKLADLKIPGEQDGRFPIVLEAMRRLSASLGSEKALYGLITGPFTLALHLLGTEIFYQMIDDPANVHGLMEFATQVGINTARMFVEAGMEIIAVVDPMTSQISPDSFAEFVLPYMTRVFDAVHDLGKLGTLFVCGNTRNNIEVMCQCHADGLSIDENIPLDYVRDVCSRYGMSFGGNIKLTVSMLFGTPADNVDVVTLDSESCAPCQYMMEAVYQAARIFGESIVYKEHKIKAKEGVVAMLKLGVTNVPTLVVDGKIRFVSIIPDETSLRKVLQTAMALKGL